MAHKTWGEDLVFLAVLWLSTATVAWATWLKEPVYVAGAWVLLALLLFAVVMPRLAKTLGSCAPTEAKACALFVWLANVAWLISAQYAGAVMHSELRAAALGWAASFSAGAALLVALFSSTMPALWVHGFSLAYAVLFFVALGQTPTTWWTLLLNAQRMPLAAFVCAYAPLYYYVPPQQKCAAAPASTLQHESCPAEPIATAANRFSENGATATMRRGSGAHSTGAA